MKSVALFVSMFVGAILFFASPLNAAYAANDVYFVKTTSGGCEKKGIVEGTFGKEIYNDWSIWNPVHILKRPDAMDSILKKAQSLGANRVVIQRLDGEYLRTSSRTHGDYASKSHTTIETMIIRGVAYACK